MHLKYWLGPRALTRQHASPAALAAIVGDAEVTLVQILKGHCLCM